MENTLKTKVINRLMNGENNTLKMRIRLPNGEEFEAEGPREFIEAQRNYFLALIGQGKAAAQALSQSAGLAAVQPNPAPNTTAPQHTEQYLWEKLLKEDENTLILRRKAKLTPQEIATIVLAGARVLLKTPGKFKPGAWWGKEQNATAPIN